MLCVSRLARALRSFSKRIATSRLAFSKFWKCRWEIILRYGLSPDHASPVEIIRAELDGDFVASTEDDSVSAHVSAEVRIDFVVSLVSQVEPERPAFEDLQDNSVLMDSHFSSDMERQAFDLRAGYLNGWTLIPTLIRASELPNRFSDFFR